MESVTLVGMRPRAVGNPIENICSVVGLAGEGSVESNRLPSLAVAGGNSTSGKPLSSTTSTTGMNVFEDQDPVQFPNHDFDLSGEVMSQNPVAKPIPTRLPAIQNGGGSKTDLSGIAVKRSATSITVPMSPEIAMKLFMHKLSTFEHHEVFDYPKVHVLDKRPCRSSLQLVLRIQRAGMKFFQIFDKQWY